MIGHIKHGFPAMYQLYILLKDRDKPPMPDEIAIASGCQVLDPVKAAAYLKQLEMASTTIVDLLHCQAEETKAHDSDASTFSYADAFIQGKAFNQQQFDQYLHEWIVVADQPFDVTENPEFHCLLEYTHLHPGLYIPSASTIKRHIMKMGEDTIQGINDMIAVCHFSPPV